MARRVKNQASFLENQRKNLRDWGKEIRAHSVEAAEELDQLERDYSAKTLMAHPDRFEDWQILIKEFMDAVRDILKGIQRERMQRGEGLREQAWVDPYGKKGKPPKPPKPPGKPKKGRAVKAKAGVDPRTGETLYIIDSVKELGENVAGVTFDVNRVETDTGGVRYKFKVTKRGRRIEHRKGAPPLYDHPDQDKLFRQEQDAILRARRVIHAALIWYEERRPGERKIEEQKRRIGEHKEYLEKFEKRLFEPRKGFRLVKPGSYEADVLGMKPGTQIKEEIKITETRKIKRKAAEKARKRRKKRTKKPRSLLTAWETEVEVEGKKRKVPAGARRGKRPAEVTKPSGKMRAGERRLVEAEIVGGKFRTPKKMLKGNPLGFFSGDGSEPEAQAKRSLSTYDSKFLSWQRSVQLGRPNVDALMSAYDALENARANYSILGNKAKARQVQAKRSELRDIILAIMSESEFLIENPSKKTHQKNGSQFLLRSEKAWDQYCETLKVADLLDAHKHLILAEQELGYAKDKKGVAQARAGLKAARAELASRLKRPKAAKKKTAKKKAK